MHIRLRMCIVVWDVLPYALPAALFMSTQVSCTNNRCTSPYPVTPARPPACREFRGIGRDCDLNMGFCCGGLLPQLMGVGGWPGHLHAHHSVQDTSSQAVSTST